MGEETERGDFDDDDDDDASCGSYLPRYEQWYFRLVEDVVHRRNAVEGLLENYGLMYSACARRREGCPNASGNQRTSGHEYLISWYRYFKFPNKCTPNPLSL